MCGECNWPKRETLERKYAEISERALKFYDDALKVSKEKNEFIKLDYSIAPEEKLPEISDNLKD